MRLEKKAVFRIMLTLLLIGMLTLAFNVQPVKASGTIYIRADGSIDPPTAPILTLDNVSYTFTDNIYDSIVVERDNIVIDGAGYTLQGTGAWASIGIDLTGRSNVTIKKMKISTFFSGIYLRYSSNNSIFENTITANGYPGITLGSYSYYNSIIGNHITNNFRGLVLSQPSSNNIISENIITNNTHEGIELYDSSNNSVIGNTVINNQYGIWLHHSSDYNYIAKNIITNNTVGIRLSESVTHNRISGNDILTNSFGILLVAFAANNMVYHNNFIGNTQHANSTFLNVWDGDYPLGGNYWSDYTGVDANGDGIGDTPYIIDADNQDRYPLMHPWSSLPVHNINTGLGYTTIQEAIDAPETLDGHTIFVEEGTYYENIVVNKSLTIFGENKKNTIVDAGGGIAVYVKQTSSVTITNFTLKNGWGAVHVYKSNGNEISDNIIFNHRQDGIRIDQSERNIIRGNIIFNVSFTGAPQGGILLYLANDNVVFNNTVYSCQYPGICICSSNRNKIFSNTIKANHAGIYVYMGSTDNIFAHNNFINNTVQVWTDSVNIWDDGYPSGGNYWSDYVGVDVKNGIGQDLPGSDGIGDTPYVIDANNVDRYPLMNPYGVPPPQTYNLTITTTAGGTTNPAPGTYSYTANSSVQVTAIPDANYLFDHWELDDINVGSSNPYTVLMDKDHTLRAAFSPIPPPLSASISPLSASILISQSVTFTSTVSGGYTPYSYQWYLNGNPVSGATSNTWTFTPTASGIYYVYLKVTDDKGNTAQSDAARITVASVPVGGYSIPIQAPATAKPLTPYLILTAILTIAFTAIKRKTTKKTKGPP